tara:strand:+ start:209 stop:1450 length:1242 start_codon:yes stop_codon:yes gene_type:complete
MAVPDRAVISFSNITSTSATVSWKPRDPLEEEKSPIRAYSLQIKETLSGTTLVQQNVGSNTTSYFLTNLDSDTEYSIYVSIFNKDGRGEEQRTDFRTLKTDIPITLSAAAQQIINKFENGDYVVSAGVNNGIELVKNGSISSQLFVSTFNDLLQTGAIVDKTAIIEPEPIPQPIPEPEPTFCVNVYNIRDSGSVYSNNYPSISAAKVEELQKEFLVVSCEAEYLPTEKQVQDFYNFTPIPPQIDTSINTTMISQSIGSFTLTDGRVKGEILYIANQSFNPFYYNKVITSLVQIKSKTGTVITIKQNNLNFTETQRDERIQIDESVGNFKELIVEFYVWDSPLSAISFSEAKQIQIIQEDEKEPTTCPQGFHKDFSGKCVEDDPQGEIPRDKLIDTLKGFLFGTVALSLLARKY